MVTQYSKKRLFVKNGMFYAELNTFFQRMLAEDGYTGLEVRPRGGCTDIVLMATRTQNVIGEKGRRIRELSSLVQRKFGYDPDKIRIYVDKVQNRGLSAAAQCESLRYKLCSGIPVRRACYSVVRFIMENEAKGCEVMVSGKIRGQRAKSMKFVDGVMIHSGHPVGQHVDSAIRHVLLKQGVLGISVRINKHSDKGGQQGSTPLPMLPDNVTIKVPKEDSFAVVPSVQFHPLPPQTTQNQSQAPQGEVAQHQHQDQPPIHRERGFHPAAHQSHGMDGLARAFVANVALSHS